MLSFAVKITNPSVAVFLRKLAHDNKHLPLTETIWTESRVNEVGSIAFWNGTAGWNEKNLETRWFVDKNFADKVVSVEEAINLLSPVHRISFAVALKSVSVAKTLMNLACENGHVRQDEIEYIVDRDEIGSLAFFSESASEETRTSFLGTHNCGCNGEETPVTWYTPYVDKIVTLEEAFALLSEKYTGQLRK